MSEHCTPPRDQRSEKRRRLTDLVRRLGESATAAEIREYAYREGIGHVNGHMLVVVRNETFPQRPRHAGGSRREDQSPTQIVMGWDKPVSCPECGGRQIRVKQTEPLEDGTARRGYECRLCRHRWRAAGGLASAPNIRRQSHVSATHKECSTCHDLLPVSRFGKKMRGSVLYRSSCKECLNKKRAEHALRTTLAKFDLTPETYEALLSQQDYKCAICGSADKGTRPTGKPRKLFSIDHCHRTGKARGLLCNKCNLGLGNFNDDLRLLDAATGYLRRHCAGKVVERR